MLAGIASLVFIPLLAIAMAHLMWAFGSTWPVKTEADLARTVAGYRGVERMPHRLVTFGMALAIFAAGVWALLLSDPAPDATLIAGGLVLTLVFTGRGIAGYLPRWRELTPEQPFAAMDRKIYSPLCLWIGTGFALLTILNAF